jgi:hypothetical protein
MKIEKWLNNVYYDKCGQYFFSEQEPNGGSQMIGEVRGWGALQHEFKTEEEAENFQDAVGEFIAQAIREKVERDFKKK